MSTPKQPREFSLVKLLVRLVLVIAMIAVLVSFMMPVEKVPRPAARRSQCKNNLKQIAIALHNYHDRYHALPPAYTVDADGKPLHSWRTLILPYMDQQVLYDKIDLTKPWDDPENAEALKNHVYGIYFCPSSTNPPDRVMHTTYLAVVTPESCIQPSKSRKLSEITDKHSETLMVIEVDSEHSVPWMAPLDADTASFLAIGPKSKLVHTGGFHAACVDGTIRFLNAEVPAMMRRALISIAGNEELSDF